MSGGSSQDIFVGTKQHVFVPERHDFKSTKMLFTGNSIGTHAFGRLQLIWFGQLKQFIVYVSKHKAKNSGEPCRSRLRFHIASVRL